MYRVGEQTRKRRRRHLLIAMGISLVALVFVFWAYSELRPETSIGLTPPASVGTVADSSKAKKHFDELNFTVDLPADWEKLTQLNSIYKPYGWQNTAVDKGVRSLVVYEDRLPTDMALNRLVVVQAAQNHLLVQGQVSDNCINFTQSSQIDARTATAHAKWNGIDFICDTGNYLRNVVGTGSADGLNKVTLRGATQGVHNYLLVYTDNTGQPDYNIFYDALSNFRVK